jgi:hypothetical protein
LAASQAALAEGLKAGLEVSSAARAMGMISSNDSKNIMMRMGLFSQDAAEAVNTCLRF